MLYTTRRRALHNLLSIKLRVKRSFRIGVHFSRAFGSPWHAEQESPCELCTQSVQNAKQRVPMPSQSRLESSVPNLAREPSTGGCQLPQRRSDSSSSDSSYAAPCLGPWKPAEILCALLLLGFSLPAHPYAKAPICIMVDRRTEPKTIVSMTATSVVSETCTSSRQVENRRRKSWGGNTFCLSLLRSYYTRLCKYRA